MNRKCSLFKVLWCLFILGVWLVPTESIGNSISFLCLPAQIPAEENYHNETNAGQESLDKLNNILRINLEKRDIESSRRVAEKIILKIKNGGNDENDALSTSYYLVGIYYHFLKNYNETIRFLELSARLKEQRGEYDERYARILYNMGLAYYDMGDFTNQERFCLQSLEIEKKIYGDSNPMLISTYSILVIAYLELQEYEKALEFSNIALKISDNSPVALNNSEILDMASVYNNLGVLYMRLADYTKAKVYLEKAESIYLLNNIKLNENIFNLLNSMAITYGFLGLSEKSDEYYMRGIDMAFSYNSALAYNYLNSYAIALGKSGQKKKGETLLADAVSRAKTRFGERSSGYIMVLYNYAEYLREFKIDNKKALECYRICLAYLKNNDRDLLLKDPVYLGYSLSLAEQGDYYKALDIIQTMLFPDDANENGGRNENLLYKNPDEALIKPDKISLKILRSKYQILWKTYDNTHDLKILETASSTSKLIVKVLEKVRINISEEDSRLILGDRYRDSYLNAIHDCNLLYRLTDNSVFLDEAFEFSEKSKVAGLLAATRELNASQFNIPSDLSDLEKKLKRDISLVNAKIAEEVQNQYPDTSLLNKLKENLLKSSLMKDSLITVFENKFPGYYSFKYNTSVTPLNSVQGIIGRNGNYINYIISDTVLYIFVANRQNRQLIALPADSNFYSDIKEFRTLLGMPSPSGNAREAFERFTRTGYRLYQKIIEPIRPYLISKKLLISPDNILSYIPFEAIPTDPSAGKRILYNQIPYLMNEFDISYTYSVTFLAESMKRKSRLSNSLIAFAPSYSKPVDIGKALMNRQLVNGVLPDLPYAKQEAEYVSYVTNGKLYENDEANETVFKNESGKYDIIHLAMHTILNDRDPMYSTLIFSAENDSTDDRYLKTYEVYSIPLRAKMVVLSSCNSGMGYLYSGEGILSLARGFMYSGSESVVMAMWEIEDRSGTEIVKSFYDNLKKGYSKSSALRRARIKYLSEADQLRSHPYFWSALVVYGNDSPLYYSKYILPILSLTGMAVVLFMTFYFWRRKYS